MSTIEGLAPNGTLHPLQEAFWAKHGSAVRVLHAGHDPRRQSCSSTSTRNPTAEQIRQGIEGNLCRCTGYQNIVRAVREAAARREVPDDRYTCSARESGGVRIRASSPAPPRTRTTSCCPAWCTRRCFEARTLTRGSKASTRPQPRPRPASLTCSLARTPQARCKPVPCAWLVPNSDLKVAAYSAIAKDTVRYVGDSVAVVVAENRYQAQDALDLIEVDYEALRRWSIPSARLRRARPSSTPTSLAIKRFTGRSLAVTSTPRSRRQRSSCSERIVQQRLIPTAMEPRGGRGAISSSDW